MGDRYDSKSCFQYVKLTSNRKEKKKWYITLGELLSLFAKKIRENSDLHLQTIDH